MEPEYAKSRKFAAAFADVDVSKVIKHDHRKKSRRKDQNIYYSVYTSDRVCECLLKRCGRTGVGHIRVIHELRKCGVRVDAILKDAESAVIPRFGTEKRCISFAGHIGICCYVVFRDTYDFCFGCFARSVFDSHRIPGRNTELFAYQIRNSTDVDDCVLDIFGGSGTTVIACEQTQRRAFVMELDEKFCDVIRRRWAEFTNGDGCDWEALTPEVVE